MFNNISIPIWAKVAFFSNAFLLIFFLTLNPPLLFFVSSFIILVACYTVYTSKYEINTTSIYNISTSSVYRNSDVFAEASIIETLNSAESKELFVSIYNYYKNNKESDFILSMKFMLNNIKVHTNDDLNINIAVVAFNALLRYYKIEHPLIFIQQDILFKNNEYEEFIYYATIVDTKDLKVDYNIFEKQHDYVRRISNE